MSITYIFTLKPLNFGVSLIYVMFYKIIKFNNKKIATSPNSQVDYSLILVDFLESELVQLNT